MFNYFNNDSSYAKQILLSFWLDIRWQENTSVWQNHYCWNSKDDEHIKNVQEIKWKFH